MNTSIYSNTTLRTDLFKQNMFRKSAILHFSSSQALTNTINKPNSEDMYVNNKATIDKNRLNKEKKLAKTQDYCSYMAGTGFFLLAAGIAVSSGASASILPSVCGVAGIGALIGAAALYITGNNIKKELDKGTNTNPKSLS